MSARYVDIIIDISHEAIDRVFQYAVPDRLSNSLEIGMQVKVPFGKGNRTRTGYVVGFSNQPDYDEDRLKQIYGIEEKALPVESELIRLAAWMKETYGSTMYQALKTVMPIKKVIRPVEKKTVQLAVEEEEGRLRLLEYRRKKNAAKVRVMEALLTHGDCPYTLLKEKLNISPATFSRMTEEGTITILTERQIREAGTKRRLTEPEPELNDRQKALTEEFKKDFQAGSNKTYLLHGVTGSGKTEVYMHAIDTVVEAGRQVIVLIPEISLTFQTVMRFQRHFGDRITILNSRMSDGERYDQFERIRKGEVSIVIGPRSALFAPFTNLGLIVMDEEHEGSYKSDNVPKYHARETALKRAELSHASVILGSATPSLVSYYRANQGDFTLWELTERVSGRALPSVTVVDLREELRQGNRSRFSIRLQELLADRLGKGQQSILFMNRRGYASFVSCRSCGEVVQCPHCQVSLTYHDHHAAIPRLICHYCGYEESFVKQCKKCGSKLIGRFGSGTEMVEAELKELFPEARVLRMDADTTKGKNGHEEILAAFSDGKADILVGTQMIVKGHDFPNVTLVGILAADISLHSQDYMAAERTFDLLTQAAGRAGRGELAGEVVIQTYDPEQTAIQTSARQDYEGFYENEIAYRMALKYPPVYSMTAVLVTGIKEEVVETASQKMAEYLRSMDISFMPGRIPDILLDDQNRDNSLSKQSRDNSMEGQTSDNSLNEQIQNSSLKEQTRNNARKEQIQDKPLTRGLYVVGPTTPVIGKIKDIYRRIFYMKSKETALLTEAKNTLETYISGMEEQEDIKVYFDLNPMNGY